MDNVGRDLKRIMHYFKARQGVSALYLYGGTVRMGFDAGAFYGVGVLSSLKGNDSSGLRSLELDCHVQCEDVLDVVCLDTAPAGLRHHVARCGSVVFERDRMRRVAFETKAMNSHDDFIAMSYGLGPEVAGEIVLDMLEDDMGF